MFRTGAAAVPLCSASSSLQIDNKMHNVNCTCHFPNGMVRALSASNSPCALSARAGLFFHQYHYFFTNIIIFSQVCNICYLLLSVGISRCSWFTLPLLKAKV